MEETILMVISVRWRFWDSSSRGFFTVESRNCRRQIAEGSGRLLPRGVQQILRGRILRRLFVKPLMRWLNQHFMARALIKA